MPKTRPGESEREKGDGQRTDSYREFTRDTWVSGSGPTTGASTARPPVEEIRPGERLFFEPGEGHRHGAAPDRFMTRLAMHEADDGGSPASWGEHITDEEYGATPHVDG